MGSNEMFAMAYQNSVQKYKQNPAETITLYLACLDYVNSSLTKFHFYWKNHPEKPSFFVPLLVYIL